MLIFVYKNILSGASTVRRFILCVLSMFFAYFLFSCAPQRAGPHTGSAPPSNKSPTLILILGQSLEERDAERLDYA